jgi:hypothetical protein
MANYTKTCSIVEYNKLLSLMVHTNYRWFIINAKDEFLQNKFTSVCTHGMRLHVGRAEVASSYRIMPAHHTPCGHKRGSTGTAPRILNFGTRQSGQLPALALTTEERAPASHWMRGWVRARVALIFWTRERSFTPAANQTLDHSACSLVNILTTFSSS